MALSTQPYKGTRDFYPNEMRVQKWMFDQMREAVERFGYREYDGPMLEPFELYAAKTGEEIINQQLYWLMDRGERKLAIRPEMTPTMARMVAAQINEIPRPVRWFSIPNLWRYERPQRGRLREHWQLNVDVLGGDPLLADAEILSVAAGILQIFGGAEKTVIRVNNRRLVDHFFVEHLKLSPDAALKTTKALDAREKIGEEKFQAWLGEIGISQQISAQIEEFFSSSFEDVLRKYPCPGVDELKSLFEILSESAVGGQVQFDPMILRGMDYYTGTVFELYDTSPENRRAMFGGGRYDNLMSIFDKPALSGVGFGMGDVTLRNFLETHSLLPPFSSPIDVFVTLPQKSLRQMSDQIATQMRALGLKVITPLNEAGFGAQLKLASKHLARFVVLLGETELAEGKVVVKELSSGQQEAIALERVAQVIAQRIRS